MPIVQILRPQNTFIGTTLKILSFYDMGVSEKWGYLLLGVLIIRILPFRVLY